MRLSSTARVASLGLLLLFPSACQQTPKEPTQPHAQEAAPHAQAQPAALTTEPLPEPESLVSPLEPSDPPHPKRFSIALGGDIQYGKAKSRNILVTHGNSDPWAEVSPLLEAPNLTIVNLENPLTEHCRQDFPKPNRANSKRRRRQFRGVPDEAIKLANAGIDVAIVANNHAADCGIQGARDTVQVLSGTGIQPVGMRFDNIDSFTPVELHIDGEQIFIFAITTFVNLRMEHAQSVARLPTKKLSKKLAPRIQAVREQHPNALIIVSLHWGREHSLKPTQRQIDHAHALVDSGANLIMGHHTHTFQAIDTYRDAATFYSLGNLYFFMERHTHRQSAIPIVELERDPNTQQWRTSSITLHPIYRRDMAQGVTFATPTEAAPIWKRLARRQYKLRKQTEAPKFSLIDNTFVWNRIPTQKAVDGALASALIGHDSLRR